MEPAKTRRKSQFKYKVDKEKYESDKEVVTGEEILKSVGKTSECYELVQKFKNKKKLVVEPSEKVDLSEPGIEKFFTIPKEQKEGLS